MSSAHVERLVGRSKSRKAAAARVAFETAGLADSVQSLDRLVADNLRFTATYYARCWGLMARPSRAALRRSVVAVGEEYLRRSAARGHGVILVSVHLGDFDLAGHWVAEALGCGVVVATPSIRPPWRGRLYDHMRRSGGFVPRRLGETTVADVAADLRAGNVVLVMADRRPRHRTIDGSFLGCPASISPAPAVLSALTGAPILSAFTTTQTSRQVCFGTPRTAAGRDDRSWLEPTLEPLEEAVRQAPHQWHVPADVSQLSISVGRTG